MHDFQRDLRRRINLFRRYRYWKSAGCIFIHVPKVAGTSFNHALYGRTLGHYTAGEIRRQFPGLFDACFTFGFVRNPWDRLASAYRFARIGRTESMGINKPEQYRIPEFDTFERFVHEWLPSQDLSKADFVFQPQSFFVTDTNGKVILDFLGKLEERERGISHVEEAIKRKLNLPEMNRTKTKDTLSESLYTSDDMINIVADIYAQDIQLFGYKFGER